MDFEQTLFIALVSALVTSFMGQAWIFFLKKREIALQNRIEYYRSTRELKRKIAADIADLMAERFYIMRKLHWSLKKYEPDSVNKIMNEYSAFLYKWNINIIRHYNMIEYYYGKYYRNQLEGEICGKIIWAGALLERRYHWRTPSAGPNSWSHIEEANLLFDNFLNGLFSNIEGESNSIPYVSVRDVSLFDKLIKYLGERP
jgi:hypothetical protein